MFCILSKYINLSKFVIKITSKSDMLKTYNALTHYIKLIKGMTFIINGIIRNLYNLSKKREGVMTISNFLL